jgi:glucosamine kinase
MSVFAGIDAGASHTEAAVSDETLRPAARWRGLGAAMQPGGAAQASRVILDVLSAALEASGLGSDLDGVVVGATGAGQKEAQSELEGALRASLGDKTAVKVTTDAEIALRSAFGDWPGVVVMAGSGSIAYGRGPDGESWRSGGLGWRFGDEGSGFWLGSEAVSAIGRAVDGRGPETKLTSLIQAEAGTDSVASTMLWAERAERSQVARLARAVCTAAKAGDSVACELVETAANNLATHVGTLVRKYPGGSAVKLAVGGGLLSADSPVRHTLESKIHEQLPEVEVLDISIDPPGGALAMARGLHAGLKE